MIYEQIDSSWIPYLVQFDDSLVIRNCCTRSKQSLRDFKIGYRMKWRGGKHTSSCGPRSLRTWLTSPNLRIFFSILAGQSREAWKFCALELVYLRFQSPRHFKIRLLDWAAEKIAHCWHYPGPSYLSSSNITYESLNGEMYRSNVKKIPNN
jgi:hypothetical protein